MQHRKPEDDSLPRLPASLRAALWLERQQQHHFVSNMALYLSMDVVDASFAQLRGAIAAARDFSAADAAHRQYVDSLVSQVGGGGGGASNVRLKPDGSLKLSVLLVSAGSSHWVMGGACLPAPD